MSKDTLKISKAKGCPVLTWVGKRPLTRVEAFAAQLFESFEVPTPTLPTRGEGEPVPPPAVGRESRFLLQQWGGRAGSSTSGAGEPVPPPPVGEVRRGSQNANWRDWPDVYPQAPAWQSR